MTQREKDFEVGGLKFTATRFMTPRPHWRLRVNETNEVLPPGAGGFKTESVPKLEASVRDHFSFHCKSSPEVFRDAFGLGRAPIGKQTRERLEHDAANIRATAAFKGLTLDGRGEAEEKQAALDHF